MIPIRNIYFMLSYAWNRLDQAELVDVSTEQIETLPDLLASVLLRGVQRCLKDGIDRGYKEQLQEGTFVRGRLDLGVSVRRLLLKQARAACHVDELTSNILANQIVKTTMQQLTRLPALDPDLRHGLALLVRRLPDVEAIRLSRRDFDRVQLHSNNSFYKFLIDICRVVHDGLLVDSANGEYSFRSFIEDEHAMRRLFQHFVSNLLRHHQDHYEVGNDRFRWNIVAPDSQSDQLMPMMETDITLRAPGHVVVIDTKFSQSVFQQRFQKQKLKSEHLYQLFSYLKNLEFKGGDYTNADGILLYPTTEKAVDFTTTVQGHRMSVRTVDLSQAPQGIRDDLLALAKPVATLGSA
ncbi:5-methylcytosine-specific restriction endonuclease system specificity protein McrC [Ramlibacter henchirensis]|uniref:5-methylcytosine-specific restriction endonuclease system specificity protein McrC n=1 Tax=Ramlibacter henchirensis TaxID=204072 RepID=A0A4Z0BMF4_9BURK|nr:5-methylcytosine-specific restriction endonuclease system specificity protein McrC [Ramlibacter henchirensis]TFY99264.1 5-methylcytosine-specific restriction endonuclease system specificity protein McrC [Ramlibacter henchirensis]